MNRRVLSLAGLLLAFVLVLAGMQLLSVGTRQQKEEAWEEEPLVEVEVEREPSYVLIMDLGSTGSRMQVFSWDSAVPGPLAAETVEIETWDGADVYLEVNPGLSHFKNDPQAGALTLQPLLDYARQYLAFVEPELDVSTVPLFIFGTGGLRSISETEAEGILEAIWALITCVPAAGRQVTCNPPFMTRRRWLRLVDGNLEAAFDWLAVQTYYRLQEVPKAAARWVKSHWKGGGDERPRYMLRTLAAMDLGGSSVEVAFAVTKAVVDRAPLAARYWRPDNATEEEAPVGAAAPEDAFRTLALGTTRYRLFSRAFEGGGHNHFRRALVEAWIHRQLAEGTVRLFQERSNVAYPCSHQGIRFSEIYRGSLFVLAGTGQVQQCLDFMDDLMSGRVLPCGEEAAECVEPIVDVPPVTKDMGVICTERFAGVAAFYSLGYRASPAEVLDATRRYCRRPWDEVWETFGGKAGVDPLTLSNYCASGLQVYSLLKRFGIEDEAQRVFFKPSTLSLHTSWAVGAATYVVQHHDDFDAIKF